MSPCVSSLQPQWTSFSRAGAYGVMTAHCCASAVQQPGAASADHCNSHVDVAITAMRGPARPAFAGGQQHKYGASDLGFMNQLCQYNLQTSMAHVFERTFYARNANCFGSWTPVSRRFESASGPDDLQQIASRNGSYSLFERSASQLRGRVCTPKHLVSLEGRERHARQPP